MQLKERKRSNYLMLMLGLNKTIDLFAMANSVPCFGHVLRMELDFEVDGQRKKACLKRTWKKQVEEESVKVGLRRKDALSQSKWSVGINLIAAGMRLVLPPSLVGGTSRF